MEVGEFSGVEVNNMYYLGEMYFFCVYIYFIKLVVFGDFFILKYWILEDYEIVREVSKWCLCNEVVCFII